MSSQWAEVERLRAILARMWRAYRRGEAVNAREYGRLATEYAELLKGN